MPVATADRRTRQVGQPRRLQLLEVAQQGAGGADGRRVVGSEAESLERGDAEPPCQVLTRQLGVELPGFARGEEEAIIGRARWRLPDRHDQFGGSQPPQRLVERGGLEGLEQKLSGAQIDGRQADGATAPLPALPLRQLRPGSCSSPPSAIPRRGSPPA